MDSRRDMIAMMTAALFAGGASPAAGTVDGAWMKTREDVQAITTPFGEVRISFKGETDQLRLLELLSVLVVVSPVAYPRLHDEPNRNSQLGRNEDRCSSFAASFIWRTKKLEVFLRTQSQ